MGGYIRMDVCISVSALLVRVLKNCVFFCSQCQFLLIIVIQLN